MQPLAVLRQLTARRALAAATALAVAAGLSVAVATSASAATTPTTLNFAPSAAAVRPGLAQLYSGIARDSSGAAVSGASVTVTATQKGSGLAPSNPLTVTATGASEQKGQSGFLSYTYTDTVTLTTAANGAYSFTVASKNEGSVTVAVASGTVQGAAALTVSAGGQGDAKVNSLAVTPTSSSQWAGTSPSYTVTAKDSTGGAVPSAQIDYRIASGPDASANGSHLIFGTTNAGGQASATVANNGQPGTDTIVFFVDAASVPSASSVTSFALVPASTALTVSTPSDSNPAAIRDQQRAGTATDVQFSAQLVNGTQRVSGALIVFTPSGAATQSQSAKTNGAGVATVSFPVTAANAGAGKTLSVVASVGIAGKANYRQSAAKTVRFTAPAPYLSITPSSSVQAAVGGTATFTAHVVDQFAVAYPAQSLSWAVNGRNGGQSGTVKTDSSGAAVISYPDRGTSSSTDTVTLTDTSTSSVNSNPASTESVTVTFLRSTAPSSVSVSGLPVSTVVDSSRNYPVSATVTNSDGTPLTFQSVTVTVDRGWVGAAGSTAATGLTSYQTSTDGSGNFTAYVGSTRTGTQSIKITAGTSGAGVGSASVLYTPSTAYEVHLVGSSAFVPKGGNTTYTATVRDEFGNAVGSGVALSFTSTGAGAFTAGTSPLSQSTGTDGTAAVTLGAASSASGTGTVVAALVTTPAQATDTPTPPTPSSTANYTIGTPPPGRGVAATITLTASAGIAGGHERIIAVVLGSDGHRLVGSNVAFAVTGANTVRRTSVRTNSNGVAVFRYRAKRPGTDTVAASSGAARASAKAFITEQPRLIATSPAKHTVRLLLKTIPKIKGTYAYLYLVTRGNVRHYLGVSRTNRHGVAVYTVPNLKSGKRYAFTGWLADLSVPEAYATNVGVRVR